MESIESSTQPVNNNAAGRTVSDDVAGVYGERASERRHGWLVCCRRSSLVRRSLAVHVAVVRFRQRLTMTVTDVQH